MNVTTHLKVIQLRPDPPPIVDYQVPVLLEPVDVYQLDQWDLTSNQVMRYFKTEINVAFPNFLNAVVHFQILLHINGVNHVKKISALANVDNNLVKSCLQNLV